MVRVGGLLGWIVVYCLQSRSKILHFNGSVTISSEGLQNLISTYDFQAGRDPVPVAMTQDQGFCKIAPYSRLARQTRYTQGLS